MVDTLMADGKVDEIDDQILGILNTKSDITGPVHFGQQIVETEENFLTLSSHQLDDQHNDRTLRFIEVVVTRVLDDRESAPLKTTSRTHEYMINLYINYEDVNSFSLMRNVNQTVMDLINDNWKPQTISGSPIISITPAESIITLEILDGSYQVYRSEISILVEEYISHV